MTEPATAPTSSPLPGAIGVSRLRPYSWPSADGVCGGGPHMHLTSVEAYLVTAGRGGVQTLTLAGYQELDLEEGLIAWFTPGTIHRMVEGDGLQVAVLMQNSGLPEAGDAVLTFPPDVLDDPASYRLATELPAGDEAAIVRAARRRRDLAVEGYLELRAAFLDGDSGPLRRFQHAATELVRPRLAAWLEIWRDGPRAAVERTGEQLRALSVGDSSHLADAAVSVVRSSRPASLGLCGWRDEYQLPTSILDPARFATIATDGPR